MLSPTIRPRRAARITGHDVLEGIQQEPHDEPLAEQRAREHFDRNHPMLSRLRLPNAGYPRGIKSFDEFMCELQGWYETVERHCKWQDVRGVKS